MSHEPDVLRRFVIEDAGVRGVIVRLDEVWRQIQSRAAYPDSVALALGELAAASTLFAGDIKFAGAVSVQLRGQGNIDLGFAECSSEGHVRGLMRWKEPVPARFKVADFGEGSILAITIERANGQRYQGLVPLEGEYLAEAFERYFEQSEQLPTAIRLAVSRDCAAGMLIQQLASEGGHAETAGRERFDDLAVLFRTLSTQELLELDSVTILRRLFAEEDIRVMGAQSMQFKCRCSREKVALVMEKIGREEAFAAVQASGFAEITCEFCNQQYRFDPVDLEAVFAGEQLTEGSSRAH